MHSFFFWLKKIRDIRILQLVLFSILGIVAFYKTFSFWFYHGWETSWLLGITGGDFSLINLMKSHGLISYVNLLLFGWKPAGWFVTAIIYHVITAMVINVFLSRKTNKTIGLVAGMLFLVTTAHHDVVTWGSFESLYAVQTLCFYLGLWFFDIYRTSNKMKWYVVTLFWFLLSLIIRESGLIFLPLLFIFDLIFHEHIFDLKINEYLKCFVRCIKRHFLLWIIAGLYIFNRSLYGGSGHDFIDERVQFRILLFNEHRYLEYIWYGVLSFGHFIGPYVIPYPVLNLIRDIFTHFFTSPNVKIYFFTVFGWMTYLTLGLVVWTQRKSRYGVYLLFSFLALTAVTMFYSFAWTTKESFLVSSYAWSENRWRYLGFTFFASIVSVLSHKALLYKKKKLLIGFIFITLYVAVNILLLHRIENQMYRENSKPAVIFYQTFLKAFPNLTNMDIFYVFRSSPGLNDYMLELSYIYPSYYPKITKLPKLWTRYDMYYILKGFREKADWVPFVHFIDYTPERGVRDYTEKAKEIMSTLAPIDLEHTVGTNSAVLTQIQRAHPVDFRYTVSMSYRAYPKNVVGKVLEDQRQMDAVSRFSNRLAKLIQSVHITACPTMGDIDEPFYDLRNTLALDGVVSARSYWWANCRPAWITLDLGSQMTLSGAAWSSITHTDAFPRDYWYEVSNDGETWEKVWGRQGNEQNSRFDLFETEVRVRFIRLWVKETSYRQMVRVDEFIPLFPETLDVSRYYESLTELYKDMHEYAFSPVSWVKVSWITDPDNTVPAADTTMYVPITIDGTYNNVQFELLESDFYSAMGQFLKRRLTNMQFEVPDGISLGVANIELAPQK